MVRTTAEQPSESAGDQGVRGQPFRVGGGRAVRLNRMTSDDERAEPLPEPNGDGVRSRTGEAAGRRVVIAGGSGFLGVSLGKALRAGGYGVTVLSRSQPAGETDWVRWDGRRLGDWVDALDGAAAVVNLAGRSVDCRKTPDRCDEILRSRVESTRAIGQACERLGPGRRPAVWVQMSTAHIYGDPPEAVCDESSALGHGLAPDVGRAWEAALAESRQPGQRTVRLRTSFVIGRDRGAGCGALGRLVPLARLGLGGRVGRGRQGFSWIHEDDFNAIVGRAIEDGSMSGAYIVSGPQPVSQAAFMRALRGAVGMPIGLPTPAWAVRLGARWVLDTDPDLALYGRYVVPQRLLDEGFAFAFPEIGAALRNLV